MAIIYLKMVEICIDLSYSIMIILINNINFHITYLLINIIKTILGLNNSIEFKWSFKRGDDILLL